MAHRIEWYDYESCRSEPAYHGYHLSPQQEDALLDDGIFLKRRVWRRMNNIRRQHIGKNAKNDHLKKVRILGRSGL